MNNRSVQTVCLMGVVLLIGGANAVGDLLMDLDRPGEALEAYKASDAIWPERYNTLIGAARAAREAGDERTARKYYERLLGKTGDSERAGLKEADAFLRK